MKISIAIMTSVAILTVPPAFAQHYGDFGQGGAARLFLRSTQPNYGYQPQITQGQIGGVPFSAQTYQAPRNAFGQVPLGCCINPGAGY